MNDSIDLLKKLVSINSVFPNEKTLAHYLKQYLEKLGFETKLQEFGEGRVNVLASRGTSGKCILLYGHMDTVPAYGYDETDRNPLELVEKDGKLFGLGSYDMKAGIAAILKSLEKADKEGRIKVMFVSDEEADSTGTYEAIKSGFLKDVEFAIATEISDIHKQNEKTRTITLGRRGRVQYSVIVPGKSFHAARMEKGISAITEASKIAIEIEKMNKELPKHDLLSHGNQYVRKFFSESTSLSVPDSAMLLIDRHLVPPETAESVLKDIQKKIDFLYEKGKLKDLGGKRALVKIQPRYVPYLMPYVTEVNNPHLGKLCASIKKTLKVIPKYNYGLSVADENLIAVSGIPVASYGPIGEGEHSNQEWVSKKSYLELIDVLGDFLSKHSSQTE